MPISIEIFAIGDPEARAAIENVIREVMAPISGDWRVSLVGSQVNDVWQLKIQGPNTNRSYNLYGTDGQHEPQFVREFLTDNLASPSAPSVSLEAPVADAWARLGNSSGSKADVHRALHFIAENWSKGSDDFSVAQKWGKLSSAEVTRLRDALKKEGQAHVQEFEKLVWGVARGAVALEFFNSLGGLSTTLRQIAYVKGFRGAPGENRVLILCALSRESPNLIETCMAGFPRDPLVDTFHSYMQSPSNALRLHNEGLSNLRDLSDMDLLFGIASLRVPAQNRYIGELTPGQRAPLWRTAERLVRELPTESFGKFVRLRLSVFVCLAAADQKDADSAKQILMASADPIAVDVLQLTDGTQTLVAAFEQLTPSVGEEQPKYLAAVIDALRRNASGVLSGSIGKLESWSKSKSPLLSVAAQAALFQLQRVKAKDFQRVFLKAARAEKGDALALWLADNSNLVDHIDLAQLPRGLWKSLLTSFLPIDPRIARLLIEAKIGIPESERYLQDSIEILVTTDAPAREPMLKELILEELQRGFEPGRLDALSKEPVRSLIQRRFWILAKSADDGQRMRLVDAIRTKMSPADAMELIRSGLANQPESQPWIMRIFIPLLLRTGILSPNFGQALGDPSLKEGLAMQLSASTVTDWQYLAEFPNEWRSARARTKTEIFSRLRGGLQAALVNIRKDSPLRAGVERLSSALHAWEEKDSPQLEPELNLAQPFENPIALEQDKRILEEHFQRQPRHPHELALFLGANPWSFHYLFRERGTWPNPELILESICKSFIFLAARRGRATEQIKRINQSVLLDMAIAIRSILSDIEAELAGYFFFRDILEEIGVQAVTSRLGAVVKGSEAGEEYRIIREAGRPGRLRVFSKGLKVANKVVDTATVMQSGAEDDRD